MHTSSRGKITNFAGEKSKVIGGERGANSAEQSGSRGGGSALPSSVFHGAGQDPPPRFPSLWFVSAAPALESAVLCLGRTEALELCRRYLQRRETLTEL